MSAEQYRALDGMSEEIRKSNAQRDHERRLEITSVTMWVCPTPNCGNFYGSSHDADLTAQFTGPKVENRGELEAVTGSPHKHNRAECPDCRQRGIKAQRVPTVVRVTLPAHPPPTPALPRRRYGPDPA
jgi:hypothetical protein